MITAYLDECWADCRLINFGAITMPPGYAVWWHAEVEHYIGHGPGEWESNITCDRFQARRWCIVQARKGDA